jgi:4-hydroxy-tetrahydrodipicolinate synthase
MYSGTYTAIVTPFRDGRVDEPALERLVENQVAGGVDGLVPVGTTGESPTVDFDEHLRIIELTVRFAAGRVKVIGGTGANSTREAIELTQQAADLGIDASLQVVPYYNRPTQEGLVQHYSAIAAATPLPILLYSVPGRSGVEIGVETARRLANACPTIVGIKEAGGSADRVTQLRAACGPDFQIISGDDILTIPFMALGAIGVISVASNVVPGEVVRLVRAAAAGDYALARDLHYRLVPLFRALFLESNPAPCKAALSLLGAMSDEVRLPLVPVTAATREALRSALSGLGIFEP